MQTGNLKETYTTKLRNNLLSKLGKENIYQVPKLEKIVVNTSFGRSNPDQKSRETILENISKITGQKPVFTKAKKAIAGFKIRQGQVIGAKVTLRGEKMYHFFEKLINIVLPRIRDFRGASTKSFDREGNYTIGFSELNIFPEIDYVKGQKTIGIEVVIKTTAKNKEESKKLLEEMGVAFTDTNPKKKDKN